MKTARARLLRDSPLFSSRPEAVGQQARHQDARIRNRFAVAQMGVMTRAVCSCTTSQNTAETGGYPNTSREGRRRRKSAACITGYTRASPPYCRIAGNAAIRQAMKRPSLAETMQRAARPETSLPPEPAAERPSPVANAGGLPRPFYAATVRAKRKSPLRLPPTYT
jgi:hypothetical protein